MQVGTKPPEIMTLYGIMRTWKHLSTVVCKVSQKLVRLLEVVRPSSPEDDVGARRDPPVHDLPLLQMLAGQRGGAELLRVRQVHDHG
jgi:hypothetical protein